MCVVARFESRKKMIFQGDIRIIFLKRKCIAFKKNYTSLVVYPLGKLFLSSQNFHPIEEISPVKKIGKIERSKDFDDCWDAYRIFRPVANLA